MKVSCVLPSAGKGKRLNTRQDKAFIKIKNKPIIFYTIKALDGCSLIDEIIVVVSPKKLKSCKKLIKKYKFRKVKAVTAGGKERFDSVRNGLQKVNNADIILIHDGARPFVDKYVIKGIINSVKIYGAALTAVPSKQTLKVVDKNFLIQKTPRRKFVWEAQTPQGFRAELIKKAYEKSNDRLATDDSVLVERLGHKVKVVKGSYRNIKITTPEDLALAKVLIKQKR